MSGCLGCVGDHSVSVFCVGYHAHALSCLKRPPCLMLRCIASVMCAVVAVVRVIAADMLWEQTIEGSWDWVTWNPATSSQSFVLRGASALINSMRYGGGCLLRVGHGCMWTCVTMVVLPPAVAPHSHHLCVCSVRHPATTTVVPYHCQ